MVLPVSTLFSGESLLKITLLMILESGFNSSVPITLQGSFLVEYRNMFERLRDFEVLVLSRLIADSSLRFRNSGNFAGFYAVLSVRTDRFYQSAYGGWRVMRRYSGLQRYKGYRCCCIVRYPHEGARLVKMPPPPRICVFPFVRHPS